MARKRNPGAACHRALGGRGARGLPALHLDRRRRHGVGEPERARRARRAWSRSSARSQPGYKGDPYGDGLRFRLRDRKGGAPERITVLYKGSLSDQFRENREVSVKGELRNGIFVARKDSLVTKCPSKYTGQEDARCLSSAAPRSSPRSASCSTPSSRARSPRGRAGAGSRPPLRTRSSRAFATTVVASGRAARRARPERLLVRLRRAAHEPRAARPATRSRRSGAGRRARCSSGC